ncbi:cytochrome P450 [Umbelopsis sp. PMI_123]|nr:cytochrome P450 [Umbelopsis sp. PMI_123]
MLSLFFSMLTNLLQNDSAIKVASITVATILAGYALYRSTRSKGPFDHLPKSNYDQLRSYTYDPSLRDDNVYEEYPPFERVMMAGVPALLINDPDAAHQALLRQDRYKPGHIFGRSPFISFFHTVLIGGANIANTTGDDWKRRRDVLVPHFQSRAMIPDLLPFLIKRTEQMVEELKSYNGQPINMDKHFVALTANVICEYIFGETPPEGLIFDNFNNPAKSIATIKMKHILNFFGIKDAASKEIERNSTIIRNVIRSVKQGNLKRHNGSATLAERLLELPEFQGPTGEERLVQELLIMIFAGHDTTAHSLTMLFYTLAKHPECQQKIREEFQSTIPDEESFTAANIGKLKYLSAAIKESMRLHPVLPAVLLQSYEDTTLGGIQIPKGSTLEVPQIRIQRDPEVFKKPCAFIPDRWLQDDLEFQGDLEKVGDDKSNLANAFMVFSQGTHSCLGMNLANLELRVATALLVINFDIKYNGPIPVVKGTMLRLEPYPLIELHPRQSD